MRPRWELDFIEEVQNLYNLKLVKEIKNYPKSDNVIIAKTRKFIILMCLLFHIIITGGGKNDT